MFKGWLYLAHYKCLIIGRGWEIGLDKATIDQGAGSPGHPFQVIAIGPFSRVGGQPGLNRVQMDVTAQGQDV